MDEKNMQQYILERYSDIRNNSGILAYYDYSDFLNFGYWDENTRDQKKACENMMEMLLAFLPEKKGRILDVACGKGATTAFLQNYYPAKDITGIDMSSKQIEVARANASGSTIMQMSATDLSFDDETFDSVISVEAAFHFNTREDFFKEAYRVLKTGGYLVLADILMNLEGERKVTSRSEKNFIATLEEYRTILERAGFKVVQLVDVTENCWRKHYRHVVQYVHEKFLNREITKQELENNLHYTYRRALYVDYYLLAAAKKI